MIEEDEGGRGRGRGREEIKAAELQRWQRAKFARELGFDPDTTDPLEIAEIDLMYENMLHRLTLYNKMQQQIKDKNAIAELKLEKGLITQEQYDRIVDGYD
jgi:hypothetical protein